MEKPNPKPVPGKKIFSKQARILLITCLFSLLTSPFSPPTAHAQINSIGISSYLPINDTKVEDGDIIIITDKGYQKSSLPFDTRIVGVVDLKPAIVLKSESNQKGFPVITSGIAYVKVTDIGGPIKKGDLITSSSTKGAGMKAEDNGFMVGSALDSVNFKRPGEIKLIQVSVSPRHAQLGIQFTDVFKVGKLAAAEKPAKILQYIVAGIITIVTFGAGFLIFSKTISKGLEALGRNPLAGRTIQLSILFNIILIIVILVAGTGLAYLVIRL